MMDLLLYLPAGFLIFGSAVTFENHSLPCSGYLQLPVPRPHAHNKYKNKQPSGTRAHGLPLISAELYIFLIRNETQH